MAYSPVGQAKLVRNPKLVEFAKTHGMTPAQAALVWLFTNADVNVIPKTSNRERLKENVGALDHRLTREQLASLIVRSRRRRARFRCR
jgi:diketogulonate reductase-like aldo/keto reductase